MGELGFMTVLEESTDARDMERCRHGDAEALAALYDRHAQDVRRFLLALRVGLDRGALEDALQETFLRLLGLARRGGYDPARPLRPYVFGIARNVAVSFARQRRAAPIDESRPDVRDGPTALASGGELRRGVAAALEALDQDARAALLLRHEHHLTMEELASTLECSVPTARARVREAACQLALELRRRGLDPKETTS